MNKNLYLIISVSTAFNIRSPFQSLGKPRTEYISNYASIHNNYEQIWWHDPRIHNFGNTGIGGKFHAFCAPYASKFIDRISYKGIDVRSESLNNCKDIIKTIPNMALDLGCGVGISTIAMSNTLGSRHNTGLDCSSAMLNRCPKGPNISFIQELAHKTSIPNDSYDFINCMFLFHEAPGFGRIQLLKEIERILKPGGYLNVLDISLEYEPNPAMLAGEPYLLDYLQNFYNELQASNFVCQNKYSNPPKRQYDQLFQKPLASI